METAHWKRTAAALLLFGCGFGYVEAAVVCYLRAIHFPAIERLYPGRAPDDIFPLLTPAQVRTAGDGLNRIVGIEVAREGATLLMLAAVALAVAAEAAGWAAAFGIVFGAWDLTYYAFLQALQNWPGSLLTWDILFLLPVPWAAPVLAPVLVSASMIGAGIWQMRRPTRLGARHWCGIIAGAAVIVLSFTLDYRHLLAGGMPNPFHWGVFAAGEALGLGSYAAACLAGAAPRTRRHGV